jgi:hypothetical protein
MFYRFSLIFEEFNRVAINVLLPLFDDVQCKSILPFHLIIYQYLCFAEYFLITLKPRLAYYYFHLKFSYLPNENIFLNQS